MIISTDESVLAVVFKMCNNRCLFLCYVHSLFFNVMYQIVVNLVFNTNSWTFLETLNPGFLTQVILNKFHCSTEIMQVSLYAMFVEKKQFKPFILTNDIWNIPFSSVVIAVQYQVWPEKQCWCLPADVIMEQLLPVCFYWLKFA